MWGMARTQITTVQLQLECHEVAAQHADGSLECAGGECEVDVRVHRFVIDCAEVDCPECGGARLAA
jgi:hypothetical protein